jgi:hypothetical protein
MYFLDPQLGKRRRVLVHDKFFRLVHELQHAGDVLKRDFSNRLQGLQSMLQSPLRDHSAGDDVLRARVRSKLGRVNSHPGAIEVAVHEGHVTLRGAILSREVEQTLNAVWKVPGVTRVDHDLNVHHTSDISALQGGRARPGIRPDILQENWSPTTRALVGASGAALLFYGSLRRAPTACLLGTLGLAMLARSATRISSHPSYQHTQSPPGRGPKAAPSAQHAPEPPVAAADNETAPHAAY